MRWMHALLPVVPEARVTYCVKWVQHNKGAAERLYRQNYIESKNTAEHPCCDDPPILLMPATTVGFIFWIHPTTSEDLSQNSEL